MVAKRRNERTGHGSTLGARGRVCHLGNVVGDVEALDLGGGGAAPRGGGRGGGAGVREEARAAGEDEPGAGASPGERRGREGLPLRPAGEEAEPGARGGRGGGGRRPGRHRRLLAVRDSGVGGWMVDDEVECRTGSLAPPSAGFSFRFGVNCVAAWGREYGDGPSPSQQK